MMRPLIIALVSSLLCISTGTTYAEVIDVPDAAPETSFSVTLPGRGMTMEQVEQRFGAPATKNGPVGTPPISTWVYDKFTVYFESNYVIHAVFHKPTRQSSQ